MVIKDNIPDNVVTFDREDWSDDWEGMPEFVQPSQKPFSKIIIRFASEEDLQEFASLIGQKLTNKTKSIWHPKLVRGIHSQKTYVDE